MSGVKISRISWIETLVLKNSTKEHFSQLTNFVTVVICSLLLILSAKIKVRSTNSKNLSEPCSFCNNIKIGIIKNRFDPSLRLGYKN